VNVMLFMLCARQGHQLTLLKALNSLHINLRRSRTYSIDEAPYLISMRQRPAVQRLL
jgi:hypothetical protein